MEFLGVHGLFLDGCRDCCRLADIGGLAGFISAAEHHDQRLFPLQVIHPPPRTEMLAHLEQPAAERFDIAKIAALGFIKPSRQADAGHLVLYSGDPGLEYGSEFDGIYNAIVIVRLRKARKILRPVECF